MKIKKIATNDQIEAAQSDLTERIMQRLEPFVTASLRETLSGNVYVLETDFEKQQYHGCGHGYIELDTNGGLVCLAYTDDETLIDDGESTQNVDMWDEVTDETLELFSSCEIKENGINSRIRLAVNFSAYALCRS